MFSSPYSRNADSGLKVSIKTVNKVPVLSFAEVLSFALSIRRVVFILEDEVSGVYVSATLDNEVIHKVTVEVLEVAHKRRLTFLYPMQEAQVRLKFSLYQCDLNLPSQNPVCYVEDIVQAVVGFERSSSFRSDRLTK